MLPDSASDPLGSIGFVQYSIKPKLPMVANQEINSKVDIYFDFNSPITTNTTVTKCFVKTAREDANKEKNLFPISQPCA
jgi:hypothetical protein